MREKGSLSSGKNNKLSFQFSFDTKNGKWLCRGRKTTFLLITCLHLTVCMTECGERASTDKRTGGLFLLNENSSTADLGECSGEQSVYFDLEL